jgi:hypothetical protein
MGKTLRQIAAGSLEIETGTQAVDFDAIVLDAKWMNHFKMIMCLSNIT